MISRTSTTIVFDFPSHNNRIQVDGHDNFHVSNLNGTEEAFFFRDLYFHVISLKLIFHSYSIIGFKSFSVQFFW